MESEPLKPLLALDHDEETLVQMVDVTESIRVTFSGVKVHHVPTAGRLSRLTPSPKRYDYNDDPQDDFV